MRANLPIPRFLIQGFRGIESLDIQSLGRVNLLVGKNNVGKTTVLEALRLFASRSSVPGLRQLLVDRGESEMTGDARRGRFRLLEISSLFWGRPDLRQTKSAIKLESPTEKLRFEIKWFSMMGGPESTHLVETQEPLFDTGESQVPALRVSKGDRAIRTLFLEETFLGRPWMNEESMLGRSMIDESIACFFIGSKGLENDEVARLWDQVALTPSGDLLLDVLSVFRPKIEGISFVETIDGSRSGRRKAIVKRQGELQPVPLRSLGEGVSRLLGITLALINARGGIVLIDEFDNGLHYSVQERFWDFIIKSAARLDVQVFATTHSRDCVAAFARASASAEDEEGVLTTLVERKGQVFASQFDEAEMTMAINDWVEMR